MLCNIVKSGMGVFAASLIVVASALAQTPLGSAFTYQGQLDLGGSPVNDTADFQFLLWDDPSTGNQIGSTLTADSVTVVDGVFTIDLDFGAMAFNGDARWLEIAVASPSGGTLATLSPRQPLTAAPYARTAVEALNVSGIDGHSLDAADGAPVDALFVDNAGNVGIGTETPGARLEIAGVSGTDGIKFPDGTLQTTAAGRAGWEMLGNTGTVDGTSFLGTTDDVALNLRVNNQRALRIEPNAASPNIIGGHSSNAVTAGVHGATISGGGTSSKNLVTDNFGTIGGGDGNQAGNNAVSVSDARFATVGGGDRNTAGSRYATVGGGNVNTASGAFSTVPGGSANQAGGDFSFAAGQRAKVRDAAATGDPDGDEGTFVWADSAFADFTSTGPDQFLIRAAGGVGIGTSTPFAGLDINQLGSEGGNLRNALRLRTNGGLTHVRFGRAGTVADEGFAISKNLLRDSDFAPEDPNTGSQSINFGTDGALSFSTAAPGVSPPPARMTIDNAGNVGVGTTTPHAPLSFPNTLGNKISLWGDSPNGHFGIGIQDLLLQIYVHFATSDIAFGYGNSENFTETMRIKGNGKVGIGTDTPSAKLDVAGSLAVQESDGTDIFKVDDHTGSVGIRSHFSNTDFNVRNKSGKDVVFRCGQSDDTLILEVQSDGEIFAPKLRAAGVVLHDLGWVSNGEIVRAVSSRRYKENIEPYKDDFDLILETQLKQWTGKGDDGGRIGFGFIAEEIEEIGLENLVLYNEEGQVESLKFRNIPFYTLEVVKRHEREMKTLQSDNETLRAHLKAKDAEIADIRARLERMEAMLAKFTDADAGR